MPIYEYMCQDCKQRFELRRSMSAADSPAACPHCGGGQTQRAISRFFTTSGATEGFSSGSSGSSCGSCGGGSCGSCGHHH